MIDGIDPNLNQPLPPAAPDVEPVEPIKPETVRVQEEKLENRKEQEQSLAEKRRKRKDRVELSTKTDGSDEEEKPTTDEAQDQGDSEHTIDVVIE